MKVFPRKKHSTRQIVSDGKLYVIWCQGGGNATWLIWEAALCEMSDLMLWLSSENMLELVNVL